MGEKFCKTLRAKYCEIKRERGDGRALLRESLKRARSMDDKMYVIHLLAHECTDNRDLEGAEQAHKMQIELDPQSPSAWTALARFLAKYKKDAEAALHCIETAVACANELNQLLLFVHNERCEVAILLDRIDLAEESLEKIRDYPLEGKSEPWELDHYTAGELRRLGVREDLLAAFMQRLKQIGTPPPSCPIR